METKHTQETHTIDARGKRIGRVASEAARVLMGKHKPSYEAHRDGNTRVVVTNAEQIALTEAQLDTKFYKRYSGYPGGLTHESMRSVIARKGIAEVIRHAVHGMLPSNKLRKGRLQRLEVEHGETKE